MDDKKINYISKNSNDDSKQWPQYLAAITATISMAVAGSHIGWTSPTLPYLKSANSHIPLTSDDASWIASFFLLGTIPGSLLAALIVDRFGRKISLLLGGLPLTLSWILIIFANTPYVLYGSRFIAGLGQGIVYVVCPMYICEIADKNIRGALGSFIKLMVTFGELYAHAVGPFLSYVNTAYACVLLPIVYLLTFLWMPESPYYLIMRNKQILASNSLQKFKRYKYKESLQRELDELSKNVVQDLNNRGNIWDLFNTYGNRKGILISFGLQLVLQFSGLCAIESYTQEIMSESDSGLNPGISVIVLSLLQLVAGIAAASLVDKLGRRPLLLSTTLFSGVTLSISSLFYFLKLNLNYSLSQFGWVLDTSIIFYEFVVALGLNPLAYMMLGELFPTNIKGIAISLTNIWASFLAFFVSKMFQIITDNTGIYTTFAWFSISCFIGVGFILLYVPETKGKTLFEIQDELNNHKKNTESKKKEELPVINELYIKTAEN